MFGRRPVARNLSYTLVAVDPKTVDRRESLVELFAWAEQRTQQTIDWYLWRKTGRAAWSKVWRGGAILLGVAGGLTPLLHAAYADAPSSEWGFLLLGLAGGFVLADRIFGLSSSWTRFMRTQAALQADLARAQTAYLSWQTRNGDAEVVTEDAAKELVGIATELIEKTTAAVFQETASWADDLAVQIEQANARFTAVPERNR
jgi:hypothetical protein